MRAILSIILIVSISFYAAPFTVAVQQKDAVDQPGPVRALLEKSYLELFGLAPEINVSKEQLAQLQSQLEREKEQEKKQLGAKQDSIEKQLDQAQDQLKTLNRDAADSPLVERQRHDIHCRIQTLRKELEETKVARQTGVDLKYDNRLAKVRILQEWPQRHAEVMRMIREKRLQERKFSDFRDVGFRDNVFDNQEKDIEKGREAIEELRRMNLLPPEIDDKDVANYVQNLAEKIARHSDLHVPLKVTVLRSREINAFALPGGFLFVNTGLMAEADNEAQLAGVIAHEIAHSSARHADRLMEKATIANIIFQAAQVAGLIFTGGISSLLTYYALQYGYYGLGLVLSLTLLGVSRDYETEADILGAQYLWHAGYDVTGFIDFFGKMAEKEGYVTGLSWFRTHPPFFERMAESFTEISILPPQEDPIRDSSEFKNAKAQLQKVIEKMEQEDRKAPTLRRVYHCEEDIAGNVVDR